VLEEKIYIYIYIYIYIFFFFCKCNALVMMDYNLLFSYYAERTSSVKNSFKDFRSSLVTQNITPINFSSSKNSGVFLLHGMLLNSVF